MTPRILADASGHLLLFQILLQLIGLRSRGPATPLPLLFTHPLSAPFFLWALPTHLLLLPSPLRHTSQIRVRSSPPGLREMQTLPFSPYLTPPGVLYFTRHQVPLVLLLCCVPILLRLLLLLLTPASLLALQLPGLACMQRVDASKRLWMLRVAATGRGRFFISLELFSLSWLL
uniref:Putative transmembrane protein n=1 Tax=Toxoplasma gondii TgCATBr9 TaxID=943120 RepID=A0A2T6IXD1_TOXGO|nr:putative transmembrane protein [Toxoplasma gondii TgCATBr9]